MTQREDGLVNFNILPLRDVRRAKASLTFDSMQIRDIAYAIADFTGHEINGGEALDAALNDAAPKYFAGGILLKAGEGPTRIAGGRTDRWSARP